MYLVFFYFVKKRFLCSMIRYFLGNLIIVLNLKKVVINEYILLI